MFTKAKNKIISMIVSGNGNEDDKNKDKKTENRPKTIRSKSLECKTRQPLESDRYYKTQNYKNTGKPENLIKNTQLIQEAEKSFEKIYMQYSSLNRKFLEISKNNETKREVFVELVEQLDQLIFALDRVEVGSIVQLKDERRGRLKLVQSLIKKVKEELEDDKMEEKTENVENVDIFKNFLNFYPNLTYDPVNKLPAKFETQVPQLSVQMDGELLSVKQLGGEITSGQPHFEQWVNEQPRMDNEQESQVPTEEKSTNTSMSALSGENTDPLSNESCSTNTSVSAENTDQQLNDSCSTNTSVSAENTDQQSNESYCSTIPTTSSENSDQQSNESFSTNTSASSEIKGIQSNESFNATSCSIDSKKDFEIKQPMPSGDKELVDGSTSNEDSNVDDSMDQSDSEHSFAVTENSDTSIQIMETYDCAFTEETMTEDFEMIETGSQECLESVSKNLLTDINMLTLQDNNTLSVVHQEELQLSSVLAEPRQPMAAPIQLLVRNAEGLFELDEAAIKSVLCGDNVKNRKIAIVSVVGAFRRGKSFLLNFMLRYIKAQGHPDWLIQSDVVEGFSWRGGRERDTTGIMMWPEAFPVGNDLALIFLDTQGTFDMKTSMKENTLIFALSTLLSSVQIYNLHERIQMDDLNNLQYFLEFGRMVQSECNSKVFENLIFLIRDWKHEMDLPFGFEGGQQQINEWLNMEHSSVTKQQAEMIDTCFKCIECFLMPNPGKKVARSDNFTGSLSDIKPKFLKYLKLFIETVLHPDKLAVKQIGGQCISAQDLLAYMKNYVEKLQHPDLEPKTLFQSMSETCHEKAMSGAKHVYMTMMGAEVRDAAVDIQALHQTALESACQLFDNAPKFGGSHNTTAYRKKLIECLDELYDRYANESMLHNEAKFHAACSDIYETYQSTLTKFCMELQHECTLEEKCQEACNDVVKSLANLKVKVPQVLLNSKLLELMKKMSQLYEQQAPYFKVRYEHMQASKTKEQYNKMKQKVVKCYQRTMDTYCGGPDPVPDFDAVHSRAEFKASKLLNDDIEKYQLTDCNQIQLEINQEIDDICKNYKANHKRKIEKKKENDFNLLMIECRQAVINKYRAAMESKCGGLKTVENIEQIHKNDLKNALSLFNPHFKTDSNICKPHYNNAKEEINGIYLQFKCNNEEKQKHNARERAYQLCDAAYKHYQEQIASLKIGTIPVPNLHRLHENIWSHTVDILQPIVSSEYYSGIVHDLKEKVACIIKHYTQINNTLLCEAEKEYRKAKLEESIKHYQDKMDSLKIDERPIDDLEDSHVVFKNEAKNILQEFSKDEDYDSLINFFMEEVQKKWHLFEEKNEKMQEIFKNEQKGLILQAYNNMKTEYFSAMLKQMSAAVDTKNSNLLYLEHQKQRQICIDNYKSMTEECSEEDKLGFLAKLQQDIKTSYDDIEEIYGKNLRDLRTKEELLREGASKTYTIGIDLGTTNCCAAVYRNGNVEIIINSIEKTTTPSVVCFKDNEIVFGETAVVAGVAYPENCISEMKRIIGRTFDDPVVQERMQKWYFKVLNTEGVPAVQITKGFKPSYKPEEISALVLGEIKRIAEVYLGSKVHDAVVTIPAYFKELQREATKAACVKAGLNVLRMINEPTAAAIAYGLLCKSDELRNVLVFDFGGGTCDVSIMSIQGKTFTVKASKGDNVLGGEDFDDRLTDHVTKMIENNYKIKINISARRRLRIACETAKKKLSVETEYELQIDEFIYDGINKKDIKIIIKKDDFEKLTKDLVQRALVPVTECLEEAKMRPQDIDEILLVGGTSKMPKIQELMKNFFGRRYSDLRIDPDEAIAYGAAIQAAISCGELTDYKIIEITPFSLGASMVRNRMGIITPKNSRIPCSHTSRRVTVKDYQTSMFFTLYQGECEEDEFQNTRIGEFTIKGIEPAPARQTKVDVTFTIDADGILHVTAVEVGNHRNEVQLTVDKKVL